MDVAVHEQPGGAHQGCLSQFQIAVDFLDLKFPLEFFLPGDRFLTAGGLSGWTSRWISLTIVLRPWLQRGEKTTPVTA